MTPLKPGYVFFLCAALLCITAFFSVGYMHPDEHFQILEFAGYKMGISPRSNMPWEFFYRMRSALQPAIAVIMHRYLYYIGITSPFTVATILRFLSAGFAFLAMWTMYKAFAREIVDKKLQQWFLLLSFLTWFALFNGVRFCSENWSGNFFIIGFALFYIKKDSPGTSKYLLTGLLMGFSFLCRYQTGLLITGFILWILFIRKDRFANILTLIAGMILVFLAGLFIDRWYYGEWTITALNYFRQNIVEDKVSGFGLQPWWFYFYSVFIEAIPPFSLVFIAGFLLFCYYRRNDPVTWTVLPFLIIHMIIGHKETRFLYPLIGFLPVMVIRSLESVKIFRKERFRESKGVRYFVKAFWAVNVVFLVLIAFRPADERIFLLRKIYNDYPRPLTLYYDGDDPYHKALDVYYYKRVALKTRKVKSWEELNRDTSSLCLFATKSKGNIRDVRKASVLVYSSYPEFMKKMDFNHWVERTHFWNVYELRRNGSPTKE